MKAIYGISLCLISSWIITYAKGDNIMTIGSSVNEVKEGETYNITCRSIRNAVDFLRNNVAVAMVRQTYAGSSCRVINAKINASCNVKKENNKNQHQLVISSAEYQSLEPTSWQCKNENGQEQSNKINIAIIRGDDNNENGGENNENGGDNSPITNLLILGLCTSFLVLLAMTMLMVYCIIIRKRKRQKQVSETQEVIIEENLLYTSMTYDETKRFEEETRCIMPDDNNDASYTGKTISSTDAYIDESIVKTSNQDYDPNKLYGILNKNKTLMSDQGVDED